MLAWPDAHRDRSHCAPSTAGRRGRLVVAAVSPAALCRHAGQWPGARRVGGRRPDHASIRPGAGAAGQRARLPPLHDGRLALVSRLAASLRRRSDIPLPNPIPILSSYSTLWALAALALLYALVLRLTRAPAHPAGNWPLAWLLTALLRRHLFLLVLRHHDRTIHQRHRPDAGNRVWVYLLWSGGSRGRDRQRDARGRAVSNLRGSLAPLPIPHHLHLPRPPARPAGLSLRPFAGAHADGGLDRAAARDRRAPAAAAAVAQLAHARAGVAAALLPLLTYVYVWLRGQPTPNGGGGRLGERG